MTGRMTAPARLLSVRLQGFKSFAERTLVTFGPGISAIVGPNGSGKSNLADALRWALGEQGRALRSRKSEDVIWAGSERKAAVGMADVQLSLDNGDGLLPIEFGVVELGRRLYRSGENEYLLNRQRVRLRDLVDLLEGAHLAENAFLFIGQGMVDQALALRPEERRPLFEEVAGVRRHERRRRRAEEQLSESEANLARVEDIVAELRPQVRRLAIQAEQAESRVSAGDELLTGVLKGAHTRWHDAAIRIDEAAGALAASRADVDAAFARLSAIEAEASAAAAALEERARSGAELRRQAEIAQAALTEVQLEEGRIQAERQALVRDRDRLALERNGAEADLAQQRRRLAEPVPERDGTLELAMGEAERDLAAALSELAGLQAADSMRDADLSAVRRVAAAREAEAEAARRRLIEVERQATHEEARSAELAQQVTAAQRAQLTAHEALESAAGAETAAVRSREAASAEWESAAAAATTAAERSGSAAAALAAARARVESAEAAIEDDRGSGFAARMRQRGARRVDDGLVVEPTLRAAVDAALAGIGRAYLTTRDALRGQTTERGVAVVVDDLTSGAGGATEDRMLDTGPATSAFERHVVSLGGGFLRDAVRRDGPGAAARLLARVAWVPDLDAAFGLQVHLPAGWVVVPRDGSAVVGEVVVRLGAGDGTLERRAQHELAADALRAAERAALAADDEASTSNARVLAAREDLDRARVTESAAIGERRGADEAERLVARSLEALVREAAWQRAQLERLQAEVGRGRAAQPEPITASRAAADPQERQAIVTWQARASELRARRDRLAEQLAQLDGARRDAERRRAAAEAAVALNEGRIAAADTEIDALALRVRAVEATTDALSARIARAVVRDAEARAAVTALTVADTDERARLSAAERAAVASREHLRAAEEAARRAEHGDLEVRLGLEGLREQLLVELAGLTPLSLEHLLALEPGSRPYDAGSSRPSGTADPEPEDVPPDEDAAEALTAALVAAGERWATTPPPTDPPTPGRLATLRRRYHELGAANPYAVEEFATVGRRLEEMERQHADLRSAIDQTRALITELDTMISAQFRTTFAALEERFDARFRQLFGGGFARLSLTDPSDLAATGIEITARPPGKKPQALAMLSGGERSLTAVALLFAMLEVRPVPFCVLDEVDAALDEANVGRFTAALSELAATTQFIVITHNRGTIEIADALYGVTVGDDSVSRVISLRLDEATELAAQARSAVAVGPGAGPA